MRGRFRRVHSRDSTLDILREIKATDSHVRVIALSPDLSGDISVHTVTQPPRMSHFKLEEPPSL